MLNRWHAIQWISTGVMLTALGVLLVCPFSFWGRLMLIGIVISAMLVLLAWERRSWKNSYMDQLLTMINLLRHDWMNDAQVLFGYIRLKKQDRLEAYTNKMKTEMLAQSQLCKLGLPQASASIK